MRVLVVSDDAQELARAVSALDRGDTEVVEATSVGELRRRVIDEGESFDVLVVDGDLRPRGGFAALYELRARAQLEGADPLIGVVIGSRDQDRWLGRWAGAADVLLRPVDGFELARTVAALARPASAA